VDASLVLRFLLPDERDPRVDNLWRAWAEQGAAVFGPALLFAEVTSTLRLRVATERFTPSEGEALFAAFNALGVRRVDRDDLHIRAWELARKYNRPRAYDMIYLALAELEDAELWTCDERLANACGANEPRLRWALSDSSSRQSVEG
jgi:predicted nucleic acid-binding protein